MKKRMTLGTVGFLALCLAGQVKAQTATQPLAEPVMAKPVAVPEHEIDANVPVNQPYDNLTTGQKAIVRSAYEGMPDTDEPPFPQTGLMAVLEPLQAIVFYTKANGVINAIARVEADGKVSQVEVLESPSEQFAKLITKLLMDTPFKPAKCNGAPCQSEYALHMQVGSQDQ